MRLVYSQDAISDLVRLRAFIAEKNPAATTQIGQGLLERLNSLRIFPLLGKPVALAPDPQSIRDAIFGKYLVRYSVHESALIVLRIWHHFEDREQNGKPPR